MKITELLITGYSGNDPVFAVTLAPGESAAVITAADHDGDAAVSAIAYQATDVFASVRDLLDALTPALSP